MRRSTLLPWVLGLAGLIPFVALAVARLSGQGFGYSVNSVTLALALYGATIASFLGGMRWGLAVAQPAQARVPFDYLLSVVPQLVAWVSFAFPGRPQLIVLGLLILLLGGLDLDLVRRRLAPSWFGRLRVVLSLGASLSLLAAAAAG